MKNLILFFILNSGWSYAVIWDVTVSSNVFTPANIEIEAGDTVRWTNTGGGHNVRANDGSFRCAQGCESEGGDGDPSTSLWVAEVTFRKVGFYSYICEPHVGFGMVGSVNVIAPTSIPVHNLNATLLNNFNPADLTIQAGEIVRIRNQGGVHNFNSLDNTLICSVGCDGDGFNTTNSNPSASPWDIYVRLDTIQNILYYCAQHPTITDGGIIKVLADSLFVNSFE